MTARTRRTSPGPRFDSVTRGLVWVKFVVASNVFPQISPPLSLPPQK